MSAVPAEPQTPLPLPDPNDPQCPLTVVLLGLPRAGKSALLGALGQARGTQTAQLGGALDDPNHWLEQARRQFYDELPRRTGAEVVAFPLTYHPVRGRPIQVRIYDCGGELTQALLQRRAADRPGSADLTRVMAVADALVLVVDGSTSAEFHERVLGEAARFLAGLEIRRAEGTEVAGLPVFLVLTKTDLLARDNQSWLDWMEQIEDCKERTAARLRAACAGPDRDRPWWFGRLHLHFWATATRRPALAGHPASPREPLGVAEWFRQCLVEAHAYRQRFHRAERRLGWTLAGLAGACLLLVALLVILAGQVFQARPSELQQRVQTYRQREGLTLAARLAGSAKYLRERKLRQLREIRQDPEFESLPASDRDFVEQRLRELEEYTAYLDRLLPEGERQPAALFPRTEEELGRLKQQMQELRPPRPEWEETVAGQIWQTQRDELEDLGQRARRVEAWYQVRQREAVELESLSGTSGPIQWPTWQTDTERFLNQTAGPPPGTEDLPRPGRLLTADAVLRFEPVALVRQRFLETRSALQTLHQISFALGLSRLERSDRPPLLFIPPGEQFSRQKAAEVLFRLEDLTPVSVLAALAEPAGGAWPALVALGARPVVHPYPTYLRDFRLASVPEKARPAVTAEARRGYEAVLESGARIIRERFPALTTAPGDTRQRWQELGRWLASDPPELRACRRLGLVLSRLHQADPADPVRQLAAFLQRDSFSLEIASVELLLLPDDMARWPRDTAPSDLTLRTAKGVTTFKVVKSEGESYRDDEDRRWRRYVYRGQLRLNFSPGQPFEVSLPLRRDMILTWSAGPRTFQFLALNLPPRRHPKDNPQAGDEDREVRLRLRPEGGFPAAPPLLLALLRLER